MTTCGFNKCKRSLADARYVPGQRLDLARGADGHLRRHDLGVHVGAPDAPDVRQAARKFERMGT